VAKRKNKQKRVDYEFIDYGEGYLPLHVDFERFKRCTFTMDLRRMPEQRVLRPAKKIIYQEK